LIRILIIFKFLYIIYCNNYKLKEIGRDSSVGIATNDGLNGQEIESLLGRDFPHPSRSSLGPPSLLYNRYRVFPGWGVKWPERRVDHPPPSSAEVKETVQLYLYSPSGPSWPVIGWTVPVIGWTVPVIGWTVPVIGWTVSVIGWTVPVIGWTVPVIGWTVPLPLPLPL
jgi:hypothetical protein